jgi:hypothetical protein
MQIYDLSAADGVLFSSWLLFYLRPIKLGEVVVGFLAAAMLLTAHWIAPHPLYAAASIICPLSFIAYLLRSRGGFERFRFSLRRSFVPR